MIQNSSRCHEIIYDPFCGSGSTILAAAQLKRVGYGCEVDPGYVAVELERLASIGLKPELSWIGSCRLGLKPELRNQ
jgi:DNA modification methylase